MWGLSAISRTISKHYSLQYRRVMYLVPNQVLRREQEVKAFYLEFKKVAQVMGRLEDLESKAEFTTTW